MPSWDSGATNVVDPPTQRMESPLERAKPYRSELPPPPRPTVRKSMPVPKAASSPAPIATIRKYPGHDVVEEPLTARLDNSRDKQDSIYGEQTATSRRPMETYEKWLAENREERTTSRGADDDHDDISMDEVATESVEAPAARKPASSSAGNAPRTIRMPERARTEVSVNVSIEEVDDTDGIFEQAHRDEASLADDRGSDPVVESRVDSADGEDLEDFPDTRNGMPKVPSAYASQPLPLMQSARDMQSPPRIATALGLGPAGFQPMQAPSGVQQTAQAVGSISNMSVPSGSQQVPMQSAQLQALRMQAMQQQMAQMHAQLQAAQMQAAQMQAAQMQSAQMQMQSQRPAVVAQLQSPAMTKSESRGVHRAPWFCLGLMFGVAAMVAAFFMPSSREGAVADSTKAASVQAAQAQARQVAPQQYAPMQPQQPMQPQMQAPSQMTSPPQVAQAGQSPASGAQAATAGGPQSKPVPTVDVRTLPIAGQKTAAPIAASRRAQRPPARRAPAPKPLADDDDAPPTSQGAAAPKPAAPPADTVSPDTLLQAL